MVRLVKLSKLSKVHADGWRMVDFIVLKEEKFKYGKCVKELLVLSRRKTEFALIVVRVNNNSNSNRSAVWPDATSLSVAKMETGDIGLCRKFESMKFVGVL